MSPRGRPRKSSYESAQAEIGEQVMSEVVDLGNGFADAYPGIKIQSDLYSRAIILPISKTGAHNGETVWSMTEANKVVSYFVAQGYKLINVIFLKDNPDPDVYIMGWFLAKQ